MKNAEFVSKSLQERTLGGCHTQGLGELDAHSIIEDMIALSSFHGFKTWNVDREVLGMLSFSRTKDYSDLHTLLVLAFILMSLLFFTSSIYFGGRMTVEPRSLKFTVKGFEY